MFLRLAVVSVLLPLLSGCGEDSRVPTPVDDGRDVVMTSFYPMTYFCERLLDSDVEVICPLPPGEDPVSWHPSREHLEAYQLADLIVLNGADFERWTSTASLPPSRVVRTASPLEDDFLSVESSSHSHGAGGAHSHDGIDGHTWLDPQNAQVQVQALVEALAGLWPERAVALDAAELLLSADLEALDARLSDMAADVRGAVLVSNHAAYDYLARRYDWTVDNRDLDPRLPLTEGELDELAALTVAGRPAVLLWESAPLAETADALEQRGLSSIVFSPCEYLSPERLAGGEDYLSVMTGNLDRLEAAVTASS